MHWFVTSWLVGWFVFSAFAAEGKDGKDIQVLAASVKGRLFQLLISIDREKGSPKRRLKMPTENFANIFKALVPLKTKTL
jgi:hypothetical protein